MDTLTMGGSEQTTPTQAMVMMFGAVSRPAHDTMAVGVGNRQVPFCISLFMHTSTRSLLFSGIVPDIDAQDNAGKLHRNHEECSA
jgi:hypothetical protein